MNTSNTITNNILYDLLKDFKNDVNRRFDEMERRFDLVDQRFEKIDQRFEKMENRMTNNESKQMKDHEILLDLQKHKGKLKITYSKHLIITNAGIAAITALLISTAFNLLTQ
ncbi:hypothetical protein COU74_01475 [Candidatus Peregrinibacteria bacterium CG10_big_fil_rev_8_21_14_0_10_36_19]|nr:MAG: hypothetical protein COU74_01475 [Candidatus Peregrinibacteria bacterium CG10_big_fil_rev_8_21_14_0_10_36_19]